ncbi:MAG: hypothetical protein ACE5HO_07035 [bacterium]
MLRKIFAKFVGSALRVKYSYWVEHPTISISDHLAAAQEIIIAMPNKIEHFGLALKSLENFRSHIPEAKITLLTKLEMINLIDKKLRVDILPYSPEDLTFFGLPKGAIQEHFGSSHYDIAIDLNLDFDLICVLLFQLSEAPLKVCFDSKDKSTFFNIRFRPHSQETLKKNYESLFSYIFRLQNAQYQN